MTEEKEEEGEGGRKEAAEVLSVRTAIVFNPISSGEAKDRPLNELCDLGVSVDFSVFLLIDGAMSASSADGAGGGGGGGAGGDEPMTKRAKYDDGRTKYLLS